MRIKQGILGAQLAELMRDIWINVSLTVREPWENGDTNLREGTFSIYSVPTRYSRKLPLYGWRMIISLSIQLEWIPGKTGPPRNISKALKPLLRALMINAKAQNKLAEMVSWQDLTMLLRLSLGHVNSYVKQCEQVEGKVRWVRAAVPRAHSVMIFHMAQTWTQASRAGFTMSIFKR